MIGLRTGALAAAAALVLVACSGQDQPAGENPYAGYPPCQPAPAAVELDAPVAGLILPDGATVQATSVAGPLTTVNAYVAATPLAVREELSSIEGVDVLHAEDEVFETELLLAAEGRRSLVKAVAVCDAASSIVVVISEDGRGLPSPGANG